MSRNWTVEEYRRYQQTGVMPDVNAATAATKSKPVFSQGADGAMAEEKAGGTTAGRPGAGTEPKKPKKAKYRNEPTYVNGIRFDSKHEANVYQELLLRVKSGELRCVVRQVGFDLPGNIRYFADFVLIFPDNHVEVWDAKSPITKKNRTYINKKKQMLDCWGIEIQEV